MSTFVNVLEEIVVNEIYNQMNELRPELQQKIKVAEVLAYTLNRLPPMFATSMTGWKYQYDRALNELHPRIVQLIKRGNQIVIFGDPIHDVTPLPNQLFLNSSGLLYQLSKLFGKKYLRWRDVPNLVQDILNQSSNKLNDSYQFDTVIQAEEETVIQEVSHLNRHQKALLASSKRFMSKQSSKIKIYEQKANSWAEEKKLRDVIAIEHRALESYTLRAELGITNVLEHLVFLAIERCTTPAILQKINQSEVAAYALNRLPPMYATSMRGFKYLRQKAISEIPRALIGQTRNGILKSLQISKSDVPKIHAHQFAQEYEQAVIALQEILGRADISMYNIVPIIRQLQQIEIKSTTKNLPKALKNDTAVMEPIESIIGSD
ncbi:late competence development ComFB family protein, partial [Pseudanabaena mucicola]